MSKSESLPSGVNALKMKASAVKGINHKKMDAHGFLSSFEVIRAAIKATNIGIETKTPMEALNKSS